MLVDFHTHLLPSLDDGSQSVEESLEMLDALRTQNVDCVVATPHFYAWKRNLSEFLDQRAQAYDLLHSAQANFAPRVLLGAEVSFFRGLGKAEGIENLCIGESKALLLEMPFSQWGRGEISEVSQLLTRGITPIIAHVERYASYQKDLAALNEVINLPVFLQVNTEALQTRKTRRFVFQLIRHGFSILLGTDCHNTKNRRPDMQDGREILSRKFGAGYLQQLDALGAQLLNIK